MQNSIYLGILVFLGVFTACQQKPSTSSDDPLKKAPEKEIREMQALQQKDSLVDVPADTITYDVIIKNPDSTDQWKEKCLSNLNRQAFIDKLFAQLYKENLKAYDFSSGQLLQPSKLKKLEANKEFSRSKIGKIQFKEKWYIDFSSGQMYKKVHSIILGYETYNAQGDIKGYKPLFKINLN